MEDAPARNGDETFDGLLEGLLGSMFRLLPSGREANPAQILDGKLSAVPERFNRFGGMR